jgi:hypothetical protein
MERVTLKSENSVHVPLAIGIAENGFASLLPTAFRRSGYMFIILASPQLRPS